MKQNKNLAVAHAIFNNFLV